MRRTGSGWGRALLVGVALTSVVALVLLLIPHLLVTRVPVGSRSLRVGLAVGWMSVSVVGLLAGLVRLTTPPTVRVGQRERDLTVESIS